MTTKNIIAEIDAIKQKQVALAQEVEKAEESVWAAHDVLEDAKNRLKALRAEAKAAKAALLKLITDYTDV
jgi:uncharacterized coiled-coil DUF342 family protein